MNDDYYAAHRKRYHAQYTLNEETIKKNPFEQFDFFLKEALAHCSGEPNSMLLSTCSTTGQPSSRVVLLKQHDHDTLTFFTNYKSQKAQDIDANPNVSCLFHWHELERQVIIKGKAVRSAKNKSQNYFNTRPRQSQLAAWSSQQSHPIPNRKALLTTFEAINTKFKDKAVPCPPFWGGFDVFPTYFEFWQGQNNRLHDRLAYQKKANKQWATMRLSP